MKNLYIIILLLILTGCKKSDDSKVDQQSFLATKVVEVTSKTGRIWMDRNLGATQAATSSTDAASFGYYYQWGRGSDGHQIITSTTTTTFSITDTPGNELFIIAPSSPWDWRNTQNDNLWQGVNGTNNPCPKGFRIPTSNEWDEEIKSWISIDKAGAIASSLKLSSGGSRSGRFGEGGVNGQGLYWSSTVEGLFARGLYFNSGSGLPYDNSIKAATSTYFRAVGANCRCIKD